MSNTNFAALFGIQNKWAPILFAVLYFLIFCWYIFQVVRTRSKIYATLAFFCLLRIVAFSLRSALANNHKDQTKEGLGVAYAIFYNVGFFSVLISAYNLLTHREKLAKADQKLSRFTSIMHKGRIVHLLLTIAVILGIVGLVISLRNSNVGTGPGTGLSHAAIYIFLAVSVLIALLTLLLIHLERSLRSNGAASPIGSTHHHLILLLIAALLLMRTLYFAITAHQRKNGTNGPAGTSTNAQTNEHFWFPLAALTELLVAMLFLVPGLVPFRHMLERHRDEKLVSQNGQGDMGMRQSKDGPNVGTGRNYNNNQSNIV